MRQIKQIKQTKKIIRIAIDGNEANSDQRVGSNVYAFEVLKTLFELIDEEKQSVTVFLAHPPQKDLPPQRHYWHYQIVKPTLLWTWWALPQYLQQHAHAFDVFFTPGHYAPSLCPIPYVSSVMDLAFLEYPNMFKTSDLIKLKLWTKQSVQKAARVITISHYSQLAIHKHYQIPLANIIVAPPALTETTQVRRTKKSRQLLETHHIRPPYILYLGTIQPRKNLITLIEAYNWLRKNWTEEKKLKRLPPPQLVLAGKIGWLAEQTLTKIKKSPYQKDILLTGYVSHNGKKSLLSWASCTVHIGLCEGFGIPILESLSAGSLPVVGNNGSLPEAVGQAGLIVNPLNKKEIAQTLKKAIYLSVKKRSEYRHLGKKQLMRFSWQESGQKILNLLTNVAQKNIQSADQRGTRKI